MQTKQRLDVPLSLKSVSDSGEFEGYGSVFGVKDSHDDVVMSGAFAASLRVWSDRKALPALLWQHRMDEPIGVYTEMKEDDIGLYVRGRLLIDDDPLAKRAHYSAAIFLIPICISFDTAEKRRYATYLILNRRFSFEF